MPANECLNFFLRDFLHSDAAAQFWDRFKQGSTFNEIPIGLVKELPVSLPPIGEQTEIRRFLEGVLRQNHAASEATSRQIELLREYRQALITAAVTGQLDIDAAEHQPIPETNEQLGMFGDAR